MPSIMLSSYATHSIGALCQPWASPLKSSRTYPNIHTENTSKRGEGGKGDKKNGPCSSPENSPIICLTKISPLLWNCDIPDSRLEQRPCFLSGVSVSEFQPKRFVTKRRRRRPGFGLGDRCMLQHINNFLMFLSDGRVANGKEVSRFLLSQPIRTICYRLSSYCNVVCGCGCRWGRATVSWISNECFYANAGHLMQSIKHPFPTHLINPAQATRRAMRYWRIRLGFLNLWIRYSGDLAWCAHQYAWMRNDAVWVVFWCCTVFHETGIRDFCPEALICV